LRVATTATSVTNLNYKKNSSYSIDLLLSILRLRRIHKYFHFPADHFPVSHFPVSHFPVDHFPVDHFSEYTFPRKHILNGHTGKRTQFVFLSCQNVAVRTTASKFNGKIRPRKLMISLNYWYTITHCLSSN
jgi:hypothetical protein